MRKALEDQVLAAFALSFTFGRGETVKEELKPPKRKELKHRARRGASKY